MIINLRKLRRALRFFIPEAIKKRIRSRLFGFKTTTFGKDWRVSIQGNNVELFTERVTAIFPKSAYATLTYHCVENGDSVEELHGFIECAKSGNGMLLDVGAAEGLFTVLFCGVGKGNRVVAYEPSVTMFEGLRQAVELNDICDKVTVVDAAVGATTGTFSGTMSESGMVLTSKEVNSALSLRMVKLDDELGKLRRPTVIKIDVEGYEGEVLEGAEGMIRECMPILFLEFHLDILESRGVLAIDLLTRLNDIGYQFESSLGERLSVNAIAYSAKAIFRFVARPK